MLKKVVKSWTDKQWTSRSSDRSLECSVPHCPSLTWVLPD